MKSPSTIKSRHVIPVALIVLAIAGWFNHTNSLYSESFTSEYIYEIRIDTDKTLRNVTLYIPLPSSESGYSPILNKISEDEPPDFGGGENWELKIVDTKYGKMLGIHANELQPIYKQGLKEHPSSIPEEYDSLLEKNTEKSAQPVNVTSNFIVASVERGDLNNSDISEKDGAIDTKNPHGAEPLLNPRFNQTQLKCDFPYPKKWEGTIRCFEFDSWIYMNHSAPVDTKISVNILFKGINSWWVYGWSGNQYRETIMSEISGENQGWVEVQGKTVVGEGNY